MNWLAQRPIAHRGLHDLSGRSPENSLPAFERAAARGHPIELDVHLLTDGALAVFHDRNLLRMTGVDAPIANQSTAVLKSLKLKGSDETIPLLTEVLKLVKGRVPLLIELKNRGRPGGLESGLLGLMQNYHGDYAVESFNPFSLSWFRRNAPAITRGQLSGDFRKEALPIYRKFVLRHLLLNGLSRPHFVAYDIRCLPAWAVSLYKIRGGVILGWTVKSSRQESEARVHCDNIIFEGYTP